MADAGVHMDVLGQSQGVGAVAVDAQGETNIRRGLLGRAATGTVPNMGKMGICSWGILLGG
ncbi:MAG: hypothetical protein ABIR04_00270 [Cypionkella sp.]